MLNRNAFTHGEVLNYDAIINLPSDKSQPSEAELLVLNSIFKEKKSTVQNIMNEAYEPFFVGILFVLFSIPQVDVFINQNIQITQNSLYFLLLVKMLLVMFVFWIIKYFHLSRSPKN